MMEHDFMAKIYGCGSFTRSGIYVFQVSIHYSDILDSRVEMCLVKFLVCMFTLLLSGMVS